MLYDTKGKVKRLFLNGLFVFNQVLFYFIVLKKINQGIIHPYFLFMVLLGVLISNRLFTSFRSFSLKKVKDCLKKHKNDGIMH